MKKNLILISLIYLVACSNENGKEQTEKEIQHVCKSNEEKVKYTLVRDDLYSDSEGNLYLKAINNENFDDKGNLYPKDVWITYVFVDSMIQTDNGLDYIDPRLKDIVDQETWRLDSISKDGRNTYYSDKKNRFYHHDMADGGNLTLIKE